MWFERCISQCSLCHGEIGQYDVMITLNHRPIEGRGTEQDKTWTQVKVKILPQLPFFLRFSAERLPFIAFPSLCNKSPSLRGCFWGPAPEAGSIVCRGHDVVFCIKDVTFGPLWHRPRIYNTLMYFDALCSSIRWEQSSVQTSTDPNRSHPLDSICK